MSLDAGSISVLCVDDEPGLADLTATFLERFDDRFSATAVESAQEGLDFLAENRVDCIVSDHDMPGTDGLAFLEAVRTTDPDLPFILFTGRGSEEIASDAISAGVSEYMQKESGSEQYAVLGQRIRNVVSRHRVRVQKQEIETRAETILEASPDAIVVSVDNEFVYANAAAVSLYDVSDRSELLGRQVGEFIHPNYRDDVNRQLEAVESRERHTDHIPRTLLTLEGTEIPVEVTARHVTWEGNTGVVAIVRDLSQQEEHIRQQERYEASFQGAFDAIVVADDEGRYIEANQSACELFGLEKEELLGRSIEEFIPEEYDFAGAWRQFEDTTTDRGMLQILRDDGETRVIEYAATANIVAGEHLSVLRDVTDRDNREDVLREMYNIISNRDQPFEEQVRALLELGRRELDVAYGTLSEILGDEYTFEIVAADDDRIQAGNVVPLSATNCEIAASTERTLVLGDVVRDAPEETDRAGYTEWGISCYLGAPVFTDNDVYGTFCFYDTEPRAGQFSEWEVTLVDLMSRWVSYELQRRHTNVRLRRQNEKLEQFASLVSHDLRNPLNVLEGSLQLAEETGDRDDFERCYHAVERMNTLIDDLLSLARSGTTIDETEAVSLASLVEECWNGVEVRNGTLHVEVDPTIEIQADRSRLKQLFENLIRNVFDHGKDDSTVTVGTLDGGFYIEDDGPGIPEGDRTKAFESGYSTLQNGTGFGLAIVKEIVDAHGWSIRVTDSESGGARFEITGSDVT
ncbi:PAS domain S-box protein [Halorubrum lipolyticum]|uniref:histidine kinase n=1 Tax=Halorubrum lipolyticum DSM 21995 TaxID=1227482 RepID=M0NPH6_9EURY|nr:PAS domain S-box protein [Halorubrum lipolyticum]EMA59862.1 pas domain s-box [Halorubrum lipolyticum DSM 21995]